MEIRRFVTFFANFPDDSVWDENEEILVPAGQGILQFIGNSLGAGGIKCTSPVQHNCYGWACDAHLGENVIWCLLQGGSPWLLITEARMSLAGTFSRARPTDSHLHLLTAINDILKRDNRFTEIRWFTKQEFESGETTVWHDSPE
jgi:hypothetical protein